MKKVIIVFAKSGDNKVVAKAFDGRTNWHQICGQWGAQGEKGSPFVFVEANLSDECSVDEPLLKAIEKVWETCEECFKEKVDVEIRRGVQREWYSV